MAYDLDGAGGHFREVADAGSNYILRLAIGVGIFWMIFPFITFFTSVPATGLGAVALVVVGAFLVFLGSAGRRHYGG